MKKYKRFYKYIAIFAVMAVLIMSRNLKELRELQDVAGISIDPAENGKYLFGLELAETDKQNSFTINSELLTVEAETLPEALRLAGFANDYPVVLTHGGLVVINEQLIGKPMKNICEDLLEHWHGQTAAYLCVADGCDAFRILQRDEKENLRAGLLSAQVGRADRQGISPTDPILTVCSHYLGGKAVRLPLLTLTTDGYRIGGSTLIGGSTNET